MTTAERQEREQRRRQRMPQQMRTELARSRRDCTSAVERADGSKAPTPRDSTASPRSRRVVMASECICRSIRSSRTHCASCAATTARGDLAGSAASSCSEKKKSREGGSGDGGGHCRLKA